MNKQSILAVPDENRIEELLRILRPVPSERFHQKMKQAAWRVEGKRTVKNVRLKIAFAIVTLLIISALFITPQGRAWAQEVFQFFKRTNSTTIPLSEHDLKSMEFVEERVELPLVPVFVPRVSAAMAALPGCETPRESQSYRCQIAIAEFELGFDLKELPRKPQGWKFEFVHYDTASKNTTIVYSFDLSYRNFGNLHLTQGLGDISGFYKDRPWQVVPAETVETVKVGNHDGEYVKGSFIIDGSNLRWDEYDPHQRLAWSDGIRWYLLELWPNRNLPVTMQQGQLIELAESLVDSPVEKTDALDPDFLYSISDAEQIAGFDLTAPTLLPIGLNFSYARYDSDNQQAQLFYGANDELVIHQWKGKSLAFDKLLTASNLVFEIVEVNGKKAFYRSAHGADTGLFLWWQKDGLNYQMYYDDILGGKLNKEKMIAIAESMQDFDDFRTREHKPYEYASIYAQALGFDIKEFAATPIRWSYANVWADPYAGCIGLVYTSTIEQGVLFINQCQTDKRFDISNVPVSSVERAEIGDHQGQYVVGAFITGDKGETVWDPTAPAKQLYWQDDGLWIQVSLSGNSTMVYDKQELISIAKRLR
jgi:hypothetical protein